jgi:chromosome segregation ATPase
MSSLNEALTSAKKEIETQGVRLRDLEAMLGEERRAREDAEERANRLERETSKELEEEDLEHAAGDSQKDEVESLETEESTTGLEDGSTSTTTADTTSRLQQRLDLMVTEMNEMKQQMERYRERAETAEADRKSLAEMIESIRRDNARTSSREARRRSRSNSQPTTESVNAGTSSSEDDGDVPGKDEISIIKDNDLDEEGTEELLRRAATSNGHAASHENEKSSMDPANALITQLQGRSDFMYHGGPVGTMISVVAIGVAVMAMLNQYPKAER